MHVAKVETVEEVKGEIKRVFGREAEVALCIARFESHYHADATNHNKNGTWDVGVMQINDVHGMSWQARLDARQNIAKAKEIRDSWGNWNAWATRHKCGV